MARLSKAAVTVTSFWCKPHQSLSKVDSKPLSASRTHVLRILVNEIPSTILFFCRDRPSCLQIHLELRFKFSRCNSLFLSPSCQFLRMSRRVQWQFTLSSLHEKFIQLCLNSSSMCPNSYIHNYKKLWVMEYHRFMGFGCEIQAKPCSPYRSRRRLV